MTLLLARLSPCMGCGVHMFLCTDVCVCVYIYICVYVCVCGYTYICICISVACRSESVMEARSKDRKPFFAFRDGRAECCRIKDEAPPIHLNPTV